MAKKAPSPSRAAPGTVRAPKSSAKWKAKAQQNKQHALATRTRSAYADQWSWFERWCVEHDEAALPAATELLAAYLTAQAEAGWKPSSLSQALAAICHHQVAEGHPSPRRDPEFKEMWTGLRKSLASPPNQKAPLNANWLRAMLDELPHGIGGMRDRALLMIGFAGGFRRSELAALEVDDVQFHPQGVEMLVRKGKTDQTGRGHIKNIAYGEDVSTCPVRALEDWLELANIVEGPLFRPIDRHENLRDRALTPHSVAKMVKDTAQRAGLDAQRISGHSLRAGFVTSATLGGANEAAVMDQTGHRSVEMVRRYRRRIDARVAPASSKLGL